jgi:EmrB/QacA subfamily drug resistance transporter
VKARILAVALAPENRKWWTLFALTFSLFVIMLDNTVVNVALPSIQRDFDISATDLSELEWVVNAYVLVFAALMLTGGKLADYFGRRRVFLTGLAIFGLSSLACGLAPDAGWLIAARAVQGAGAALMMPATLSIITATFPARERGAAIGIWAGVAAMALAIGPLIGGLITEHVAWNWIFFLNVPVAAVGLVVGRIVIRESKDTSEDQRLDVPGLVTSGLALFALTFALIEANRYGWTSALILGLLAFAAAGFAAFVLLERHQRAPMLDLSLFRSSTFAGANVVALLVGVAMFGVFFFLSLYMQNVLGYSPVRAGASFLPMTILIIIVAPIAGRVSDRVGSRWLIATGMSLVAGALVIFSQLAVASSWWQLLPGMLIGGFGMAITMTPVTAAAVGAVPVEKAGVGSGVLNTSRQVGLALGIAMMGAIVSATQADALAGGANPQAAFVAGLNDAMLVGAGVALSAALVGALTIRRHRHLQPEEALEAAA